jgi:hypothetical protein
MAYCMTWELVGSRAPKSWDLIHAFVAKEGSFAERERWAMELYEESSPSAQEERSVVSRIESFLLKPRDVAYFRAGILSLLPEALRHAAESHSMMRSFAMPSDYGKLKTWVMGWRLASYAKPHVTVSPLAEREADFARFLELPFFLQGFRRYWQAKPKYRNSRQTRTLVCRAAILSQIIQADESTDFEQWTLHMAGDCHFSEQTRGELIILTQEMSVFSYEAEELAYRFLIDAREIDQRNIVNFIKRFSGELSEFSKEFMQCMLFDGE